MVVSSKTVLKQPSTRMQKKKKKMSFDSHFMTYSKINMKWTTELKVTTQSINFWNKI